MNRMYGVVAEEQFVPAVDAELDQSALAELAELVGDALGSRVMITDRAPDQWGDVPSFLAHDGAGRILALARWGASAEHTERVVAEASVLAALESAGEGSVLVVPRLLALTRWHGGTLMLREWGASSSPNRPPSRQERHAAERVVAALATPADLGGSYAEQLRAELLGLVPCLFADRLLATLDLMAARHDLDALPRGAWHGNWSRHAVAAVGDGRVQVADWSRFASNRPLGFDPLHFHLAALRGHGRSAGASTILLNEAPRLLARWHGRVLPDSDCVARLLLIELAARELREVGPRRAPISWTADWITAMLPGT